MKINSLFKELGYCFAVSIFLTVLILVSEFNVKAQSRVTGGFEGRVVDSQAGAGIAGATIKFKSLKSELEVARRTNAEGYFQQDFLPPGTYSIKFEAEGYEPQERIQTLFATRSNRVIPFPIELNSIKIKDTNSSLNKGNLAVASLPKTKIIVESQDKKTIYQNTILSDQLLVVFEQLPAQKYVVSATLEGYQPLKKELEILPGKTVPLTLNLVPKEFSSQIFNQIGRYYALIIGNNEYQHFDRLKSAKKDAEEVDSILRSLYGFETKLLLDAGREQIMIALNEFRRKAEPNSNLLIYYAGHGINSEEFGKAYWLPVDARQEDNANWISSDDITAILKAIPSKHILVISDSCYSGALSRNSNVFTLTENLTAREKYLLKMIEGKSRSLLASGGNEPVLDGGGGIYSVFAEALIKGLTETKNEIFTADELYQQYIKESVAGKASQTPEFSPIRNSGHESGSFIFIRKKK